METRQRHDPSKSLVGFRVGDVRYAVPIDRVREIVNPSAVVSLPHPPPGVIGVADYRDDIIPIVDLRMRFGLGRTSATRKTKWIVVDVAGRNVALVVDSVTGVFGTGGAALRPAPSLGAGDDARGIAAATNYGGALVFVLDTVRLREITQPLSEAGSIGPRAHVTSLPPRASA